MTGWRPYRPIQPTQFGISRGIALLAAFAVLTVYVIATDSEPHGTSWTLVGIGAGPAAYGFTLAVVSIILRRIGGRR